MVQGDGFPYRISDTTPQFSEEKINTIKDQGLILTTEARRASVELVFDNSLGRIGGAWSAYGEIMVLSRTSDDGS